MASHRSSPAPAAGVAISALLLALTGPAAFAQSGAAAARRVAPAPAADKVPNLAAACRPEAVQAVASRLGGAVTVGETADGPKFPSGVKYVAAAGTLPAYCQVTGSFVTNPKTGKTANFLATLPANWNGKYLQYGCFGHCGGIILNDAASPMVTIIAQGVPGEAIRKGYASFGTDEGHAGMSWATWAVKGPGKVDQDAIEDFYYRADKVLAGVGKKLTTAFYGQALGAPQTIERAYFQGCSGGGRDGLVAATFFPEAFDGIIAGAPYANMMGVSIQGSGIALATIRSPGADIAPELAAKIAPIVLANCDAADGVKDGLIQNPAACDFRPERDLPRCRDGAASGQCFTDEQIKTISTAVTAVTDEQGRVIQPGYSVSDLQPGMFRVKTAPKDPSAAVPWPDVMAGGDGLPSAAFANLKVFGHGADPDYQVRPLISFREGGAGSVTGFRVVFPRAEFDHDVAAARMGIGAHPELVGEFIQQNRKLLIWANLGDQGLTPYMSINYYKQLAKLHGGYAKLQRNVRLFALPGTGHCSTGGEGPGSFDALTAMENWVEKGRAPDGLMARLYPAKGLGPDFSKPPRRTMPLCKFPEMARYSGHGDVDDAANWSCAADDTRMLKVGESGRQAGVLE
jgi:feruloyl esterase